MVDKTRRQGYHLPEVIGDPPNYTGLIRGPSDPETRRDAVRKWLVWGLLGCIMIIFSVVVYSAWHPPKENSLFFDVIKMLLSSLIGLLGTAIGFFFRRN